MSNKDVRHPTTGKVDKKIRPQMGQQLKMDITPYIEAHPDKQLMLINDLDGDVQRWLDAGAEPVPAKLASRKTFKGLTDRSESEWVRFVGGTAQTGEVYYVYCLMMDPVLYREYKHAPIQQRQEDIKVAMGRGRTDQTGGEALAGGGDVQTYAANLPTGSGEGYNEVRSK